MHTYHRRFIARGAERGRLRAQKTDTGAWLSSRSWVAEYQRNKHKRIKPSAATRNR